MTRVPYVVTLRPGAGLRVSTRSGRVEVRATEREGVDIIENLDDIRITTEEDGTVAIASGRGGSHKLVLEVPRGTNLVIGTAHGKVELKGQLGAVRVTSENGSVEVEDVQMLDARSTHASVFVERCAGPCRVQTTSGRAEVRRGGAPTEVTTESGRVTLHEAMGNVRIRTASGRVEVNAAGAHDVAVQTMSGGVKVELPGEVRPHASLHSRSGRLSCDMPEGDDCRVAVQTLSGGIEVVRA